MDFQERCRIWEKDGGKMEQDIAGFCRKIQMPEEVVEKLLQLLPKLELREAAPDIEGLFTLAKGQAAYKAIENRLNTEEADKGLRSLAVYLAAAFKTQEIYRAKGISEAVFWDTMKVFSRFVREHKATFGCYGFDRGFWTYRQLSAALFRLGTLEFEIAYMPEPALAVHIPSDAHMTRAALDESYRMAKAFFPEYFPAFTPQYTFCESWLLSQELKALLPEHSRILNFQADYKIIQILPDDTSFMTWVYKKTYTDYAALPEDTSLQRSIKKHLLSGGRIGAAIGRLL